MTESNTKRIPAVTTSYDDVSGILAVKFSDGEGFDIDIATLPAEIIQRAIVHGLNAKLVDGAAIARDTATGRSADLSDKKAAVIAIGERLLNGEWNAKREAGEGEASLLLAALVRLYPQTDKATLQARIDGWTKEEIKAIRGNARVIRAMSDIKAERAEARGQVGDDILATLG